MLYHKIFLSLLFFTVFKTYCSEHIHTKKYDQQWSEFMNLGKLFDKELDKAEKGYEYTFSDIMMKRLNLSLEIDCPVCKKRYVGIVVDNVKTILKTKELLQAEKLPIPCDESEY